MKVGDLVSVDDGRIGIIIGEALKEGYCWVHWANGFLGNIRTMEPKEMLYLYNGGKDSTPLLDWG